MRDFFLSACPAILWLCFICNSVLLILLFMGYRRNPDKPIWLLCALVAAGLVYDALILSLGTIFPAGGVLSAVSRLRFISHGALIPLLFPICAYALKLNKKWLKLTWVFTGVLIVLGIAEALATVLELREIAGVSRYASAESSPAWADAISSMLSFGTVIPLILAGIVVIIKQKTPLLFLSGFFMFAFSALGPATGNADLIFCISMIGEVLMVLFFFLFAKRTEKLKS